MNIYVGNIPYHISERDLRPAFEKYGKVNTVEIIFDRQTGRSRGYAFVSMPDDAQARNAIKGLNGKEFFGRYLRVDESQSELTKRQKNEAQRTTGRYPSTRSEKETKSGGIWAFFKKLFQ